MLAGRALVPSAGERDGTRQRAASIALHLSHRSLRVDGFRGRVNIRKIVQNNLATPAKSKNVPVGAMPIFGWAELTRGLGRSMTAAKRVLNGGKCRFRGVSLCLECSGGVLACRSNRMQEGQVGVLHVPCCLVTDAGVLILLSLKELVGKGSGFLRA